MSSAKHAKAIRQIRNLAYHPFIEQEGTFTKWFPQPPAKAPSAAPAHWFEGLRPHDRMHYHQTLNSSRRFAGFRPDPRKVPRDALDLQLQSQYQHGTEVFAHAVDVVLTHETVGRQTFRRLRNTQDLPAKRVIAIGHPLSIGGIRERIDPDNVKLMCSGHHSTQTNPGYSRQTGDGNFFNY